MAKRKKGTHAGSIKRLTPSEENLELGMALLNKHSLFSNLRGRLVVCDKNRLGKDSAALVEANGSIYLNKDYFISPGQWAYVIAHCLLHLAFGHFDLKNLPPAFQKQLWNQACDIYIAKFLSDIKFGDPLCQEAVSTFPGSLTDERKIYTYLVEHGYPKSNHHFGTASPTQMDMLGLEKPLTYEHTHNQQNPFTATFAYALATSVSNAVSLASDSSFTNRANTPASRAAKWFVDHYPLLGGLAASFHLIEDFSYCMKNDIQIAAVDVSLGEIYVNPAIQMSEGEWRFVLAHEYLHAGLQHHKRCQGKNHYLWNVACDYVINSWLTEMQIGELPQNGLLYDETLKGMSAETIYDTLISDLKKYSKLPTFRGYGKGDIIGSKESASSNHSGSVSLDEFCKSALQQGLTFHQSQERGFIPAGLIEEIKALSMPPIPWDVELANWFDCYFAPLEKHRSYARPSRRQGATPDIPRPSYISQDISIDSRTFGVVVDTSGSMTAKQIGMALGSIASYAASHDVPFARVVFCDAAAYDAGFLSPDDIAGRVLVKGRGGTVLQPAINLLEQAKDFPKDGPILIITDGGIENHLSVTHKHAYLLPTGYRLPFRPKGEVFYFKE
ncbi:MAG: hypothetical protein IJF07_00215 [Lachnospiraceae bacterium]|nr:hypothetical protein [Lachnospiraceae bacterium]